MIKVVIVENEQPNITYLTNILKKDFQEVELLAICSTVLESTEKINLLKPDVVFLDIELDVKDGGFQILNHTSSVNYEVIFTTSHTQYAAQAFRFCALHFLLRPFGTEDVFEALKRYKEKSDKGSKKNIEALLHNAKQAETGSQKVGIPILGGLDFVTVSEIIRCQASNNYTDFFLTGKKRITASKTLKWVDDLLRDHNFFRVHDSHLINLSHIKKYMKGGEGGVVELSEQQEVDVSRRKKDDFLKVLSDLKMTFHR
ncbi:MAG: LytTR family DNA-binding domain-containing protein [Bacteroidia bacterium]